MQNFTEAIALASELHISEVNALRDRIHGMLCQSFSLITVLEQQVAALETQKQEIEEAWANRYRALELDNLGFAMLIFSL